MATLILSAVGAAVGAKVGGAVLGLSGLVIGRALGATLGRVIDQRLLGRGSGAVDTGRIDRLRVTGAGEGVAIPRVWGRMRLAGHVIWASDFRELRPSSRRSKSKAPTPTQAPRYTVSLAIALCEGAIAGVGRIWADGTEIGRKDLTLRVYPGSMEQGPDPAIAAIEGLEATPAYRGTAYVVLEDLDLGPWGNRIPALSFEVVRAAEAPGTLTLQEAVRAVAWLPGSGDYALASAPLAVRQGADLLAAFSTQTRAVNQNAPGGGADLTVALRALETELPNAKSSLLVVSWFGSDLRCADCRVQPKCENALGEATTMPWTVAGRARADAPLVPAPSGVPVYGGTPADASVVQAIRAMKDAGQDVIFYPFLLMDQLPGNTLPNPYTGQPGQPALPWRGRITLSLAPGQPGSPDGTAAAGAEVAAFFGTAQPGDFVPGDGSVTYSGPAEWTYRRMILHYAALCRAAGGVDAFCIGSELVRLTRIRGAGGTFPAVAQMIELLVDVRAILGPDTRLTYASDWTEYSGFTVGSERFFHLDPLWSHPECNAIAIDNYMPISDWRDGTGNLDADRAAAIYDLDYLGAGIAGGEGFDWFYATPQDRALQLRTPITDGAGAEPWVFRVKDLRAFWELVHYDRPGGIRAAEPTAWAPRSKPIWFTELGCPAVDKGTNQPNVFFDPKSSESAFPHFSNGLRDDLIQMQYLRAQARHWAQPHNNPESDVYAGRMVDWSRAHVWAWDARPWPWFPANRALWADGANWLRGHWLTGRAANQPLAAVVAEICLGAGLAPEDFDVSALHGLVRGYSVASTDSGRAALQPLMVAYGIEAVERDGTLIFRLRDGVAVQALEPDDLVARDGGALELTRAAQAEVVGRVRLAHIDAEGRFETRAAEAVIPDEPAASVAETELALTLLPSEARAATRRWLAESRIARDAARFALPPSSRLGPGDVVELAGADGPRRWRIDRVDLAGAREIEAVRVEPGPYLGGIEGDDDPAPQAWVAPAGVAAVLMDLPLVRGDEVPHAPHLAATASPWPGPVAAWQGPFPAGELALAATAAGPAALGVLDAPLLSARAGLWQRGAGAVVRMPAGVELIAQTRAQVLAGANLMALGTGAEWELIQFAGAELVGPGLWHLTDLLRGAFGTEPMRAAPWPAGALAVLVDAALVQADLAPALRGQARRWRVGPAALDADDPALAERVEAFRGAGLRPYAPVHLRARRAAPGADLALTWVRRTRLGGDDWDAAEVPLAEESERYLLRILSGGTVVRSHVATAPGWTYAQADQAADGVSGAFEVRVAQVSAVFGPGPAAQLAVPG